MANAIEFEGVSKRYRGAREYRALRDDIVQTALSAVGVRRPPRHTVAALDDVSFQVPEGQSFGLIGANGAGKTTALKLATRIAYPSAGRVRVRGRVGALIEVGSGMHPELTGRENINLHGRILGLKSVDIARRFDEIVEFAGIGHAIDQPVKQYSSGMQLRLGFAIAAHLEPDVLLVDEAIAVGDAGFQYRCVERMRELVREGRTLVFVSHVMGAIETLCERAVLLRAGKVVDDGPARDVIASYIRGMYGEVLALDGVGAATGSDLQIVRTTIHDAAGREVDGIASGAPMTVRLHFHADAPIRGALVNVGITDGRSGPITLASMLRDGGDAGTLAGDATLDCTFESLPLMPRVYEVWANVLGAAGFGNLVTWQRLRLFEVVGSTNGARAGKAAATTELLNAPVVVPYHWRSPHDA